jgi:hypothetical protein
MQVGLARRVTSSIPACPLGYGIAAPEPTCTMKYSKQMEIKQQYPDG